MDALRADLGIVDRTLHAAVRALDDYQATQRQQQAVKDAEIRAFMGAPSLAAADPPPAAAPAAPGPKGKRRASGG